MWSNKLIIFGSFSSVQFSCSVVFDCLRSHESQHAKPPCPSATSGVYSNSRPSSWWCHPATSSSVVPFSSCPQSLPASESFPMSQLFTSGGQSIGVSALASVLPRTPRNDLLWDGLVGSPCSPNRKRSMSRLYIVTLLIQVTCSVHHAECQDGWSTSWNQDCQEKYQ